MFDKHLKPVAQAGDCERIFTPATYPFQWVPVWASMRRLASMGHAARELDGICKGVKKKKGSQGSDG